MNNNVKKAMWKCTPYGICLQRWIMAPAAAAIRYRRYSFGMMIVFREKGK